MSDLQLCKINWSLEEPLVELFAAIAGDSFFTPHPLTAAYAHYLATYTGKDFYSIALTGNRALAYGILRGWDEGYAVPSLGISVRSSAQGLGIGKLVMLYLHAVATMRGAERIRLRVHVENRRALRLYDQLGYEFETDDRPGFLLGFLTLRSAHVA